MPHSMPYKHFAAMLYNEPLAITSDAALTLSGILLPHIVARMSGGHGHEAASDQQAFAPLTRDDGSVEMFAPRASRFIGSTPIDSSGRPMPYRMTDSGIAIITIVGELVNRGTWFGAAPSGGTVAYEAIKHQVSTAAADPRVKSILIDMQSPGGQVVGCFDCAGAIRKARDVKPVVGFVNGMAASGGYALLSACTKIISIPEGYSGSIGVFMLHVDFSAALMVEGIKPTLIFDGDHKVDGNPYEPLQKDVLARFQARIAQAKAMFVDCVAAGRPKLTAEAIVATQAECFYGADALRLGLIDSVGTFEDLIVEMAQPDSITVNVTNDGDAPDDGEPTTKQGASSPANTGTLADAAATEDDMSKPSLWSQFVAAMGGPAAKEGADAEGDAAGGGALVQGQTLQSVAVHYSKTVGSAASCGKAGEGEQGTIDLNMVSCGDCLRGEIASRNEAIKAAKEASAATPVDAEAIISTAADNFVSTHCKNIGKDGTTALRAEFVAAKTAGDEDRVTRLTTIAASYLPGQAARVDTSRGPRVEDVAGVKSGRDIHFAALAKLAAASVTQASPNFAAAYDVAVAEIKNGTGVDDGA